MRHLAVKISEKLHQLEQQNGPFKVKCLVRRTQEDTQWDLILWADWFDVNERPRVSHLMDALIRPLQDDDLLYFNAMITFGPKDNSPFLQELAKYNAIMTPAPIIPHGMMGLLKFLCT